MEQKFCSKCKEHHPVAEFSRNKNSSDGLSYWCRECDRRSKLKYRQRNRERLRSYTKSYVDSVTQRCSVEKCENRAKSNSYGAMCIKHAWRLKNWGSTDDRARPPPNYAKQDRNPRWTGDDCSYSAVHQRVHKIFGKAAEHQCVDCGGLAAEWSYNHGCPQERTEWATRSDGRSHLFPYSPYIEMYSPRCKACHTEFDRGHA